MRTAHRKVIPVMAFKSGKRYNTDLTRAPSEDNWLLMIAEDHVPEATAQLSAAQLHFLRSLRASLQDMSWTYDLEHLDLKKAHELRALFDNVRSRCDISLRHALLAVFSSFLDRPFTMQIGLFLLHLEQRFVISRLAEVTSRVAEAS